MRRMLPPARTARSEARLPAPAVEDFCSSIVRKNIRPLFVRQWANLAYTKWHLSLTPMELVLWPMIPSSTKMHVAECAGPSKRLPLHNHHRKPSKHSACRNDDPMLTE